jgi:hypothetical protein
VGGGGGTWVDNFMEDVSVEDVGVEGEVQDAGRGRGRRRSLG